jgi:L-alanine-DL-glutamate epimerase-like enolase superfamily enzyme
MAKLDALSQFDIHSIEQPIKAGQPELMAQICKSSPIEIALDEELIGCRTS